MKNLVRYCLIGYVVDKGFNVIFAATATAIVLWVFCKTFRLM